MPNENQIQFPTAFIAKQWRNNVAISFDRQGMVTKVQDVHQSNSARSTSVALPGMLNVHSHAFQRGFAGLSEYRTSTQDSFWTWRKLMYDFVDRLSPDDVFVIARQLYYEMLSAGYSSVGEFHYLHNSPNGSPYDDPSEMSRAIVRAADETGIRLCLLPVLYQRSGFDSDQANDGQKRFVLSEDQFLELLESIDRLTQENPRHSFGMAIHSLRAVDSKIGNRVVAEFNKRFGARPIHIHVAEQTQEVEDCVATHQKRSVEYLFDSYPVSKNWCLIHATHINPSEIQLISNSDAVVGLCPTTEANLGDGVFPARDFLDHGGKMAIGSDSHCSVDFCDELRTLEYGQRLTTRRRAILGTETESVGTRLFLGALDGGLQSLGLNVDHLQSNSLGDMILVDRLHPAISGAENQRLVDRLIFCNHGNPIQDVIIGGQLIGLDTAEHAAKMAASVESFNKVCQKLNQ